MSSTDTTTRLGDIEVAVQEAGEGPPVVLVHGLAQDHRMWTRVLAEQTGRRYVAYDVRGHGGTTIGNADGTIAQLGGDLVALLEELGQATCVGFSLGGTVALWAAAERPDLVSDVVAVATSSVVGRAAAQFFRERIELFETGSTEEMKAAVRADTEAQLAGDHADLEAIVAARLEAIGDGAGYINGARAMAAINDTPLNPLLERIRVPVIVMSGENDEFCPRRAADIMLEHLSAAEFEELPGVGHLVTDESPETFVSRLSRRLRRGAER